MAPRRNRRRKKQQQLDRNWAAIVEERTNQIHELIKHGNEEICQIGLYLLDVKEVAPHGDFGPWIKLNFDWSPRTATNYMRVALRFGGKFATVANLPTSFIYILADPRTPDELIARVIDENQKDKQDESIFDVDKFKSEIKAIWDEVGEQKRKQRQEKRQAKEQAEADLEAAENEEFEDDDYDDEEEDFDEDEAQWRNSDEYKKIDRKAAEVLDMIRDSVPECEMLLANTMIALRVSSICRKRLNAGTISVLDD